MFFIVNLILSGFLMPATARGHFIFNPTFSVHALLCLHFNSLTTPCFSLSQQSLLPFDLPFLTTSNSCYVGHISRLKIIAFLQDCLDYMYCSLEDLNLIMLRSNANLNIKLYFVLQKHTMHKGYLAVALCMWCLPMVQCNCSKTTNDDNNKKQQ